MINLRLRMLGPAAVAMAGCALIVACNTSDGGGGSGSGGGNNGDVVGIGNVGGSVNAVSADGLVVVGQSNVVGSGSDAFRWTLAGGMQSLGHLAGGDALFSIAEDVSFNGDVVVGSSHSTFTNEAFRWENVMGSGVMTGLGVISGTDPATTFSIAHAVGADGTEVVGKAAVGLSADVATSDFGTHSFRWTTAARTVTSNGDLNFGLVDGSATAIFDHPNINLVAGTGISHTVTRIAPDPTYFEWHREAYYSKDGGALIGIGSLTGGFVLPSALYGVSDGSGGFNCPDSNDDMKRCFWGKDFTAPFALSGKCLSCSQDGELAKVNASFANDVVARFPTSLAQTAVVVGSSFRDTLATSFPEAFRWQESKGFFPLAPACSVDDVAFQATGAPLCMQGLGDLPGGDRHSVANAISIFGDNTPPLGFDAIGPLVIVGFGHTAEGKRAFRWEYDGACSPDGTGADPCMEELGDFLRRPMNGFEPFDTGDWTFIEATDISEDGTVIVGNGINPDGEEEGFIVTLDRVVP